MFLKRISSTSKISLQKITIFLVVSPHYSAICATGFGVVREAVTFWSKNQGKNQGHKKRRSGEIRLKKMAIFFAKFRPRFRPSLRSKFCKKNRHFF